MIKRFPSILGYSAERTKGQLDLLQYETLVKFVIQRPQLFMDSEGLIYALIQFAKERKRTDDLTTTRYEDIFMKSAVLHRKYGETFETLKAKYPYPKKEQDAEYIITGEEIGKVSYKSRSRKGIIQIKK